MGVLRAFVACEVPGSLQNAIAAASSALRATLGPDLVRWVPVRNIHLTLKFLGEISSSGLEAVQKVLTKEASEFQPIEAIVEGLGAYPSARRPRVIWVGLTAPPDLGRFQRDLDLAMAPLGFAPDEHPFSPHLTLGRVRQNPSSRDLESIRNQLQTVQVGKVGVLPLAAVHLFRSDLLPSGAVYSKLFSAQFGPGQS